MRKIFIVVFSLLFLQNVVRAQQIYVFGVDEDLSDLSARIHERKDGNGDPCALVKVMFPVEGAKFGGDIVGYVKYDTGVYWVYMIAGSKKITISHPQYIAATLDFSKYSIKGLQAQKTYIVKVKAGESKKLQSLTISFSPSNASVIIDGKMYPSNNGKVTGMFHVGRHEVMIAAIGYESYEGSVTLRESSPSNIQTTLLKSANADVPNSIEQNYNATNVNGSTSTEQTQNTYSANSQYILDKVAEAKRLYDNKDYTAAYRCFQVAAEAGNAEAQSYLGKCYVFGEGVAQDYIEAFKWFRKSAEQGNADAQLYLGAGYLQGQGVTKDEAEAVKWLRKSAEQGNAESQFYLGIVYHLGEGGTKDDAEAVKWFRKAAEQGHANAQYFLGDCYAYGDDAIQDYSEAIKWYRKSAEQNVAGAQLCLGILYQQGQGVTKDEVEAVKWYRKSAEQGYADAQFNLGTCYYFGQGVTKDYTEAIKWFRKSAEQGNADAQCNLGYCYYTGRGIAQDYTEAVRWYRQSSEQGNAIALSNLGECYEKGHGVTKDINEALKWYKKAAETGHEEAKKKVETYPNW